MDIFYNIFIDPFVQMAQQPDFLLQVLWEGFVGGVVSASVLGAGLWWITPFAPWQAALFAGEIEPGAPYLLRIHWPGALQETEDPYGFGLLLGELEDRGEA